MFEQQGLCGNSTNTAWSHEAGDCGKEVGHEYEEIPHGLELYQP